MKDNTFKSLIYNIIDYVDYLDNPLSEMLDNALDYHDNEELYEIYSKSSNIKCKITELLLDLDDLYNKFNEVYDNNKKIVRKNKNKVDYINLYK